MNMEQIDCYFCNHTASQSRIKIGSTISIIECPICGRYILSDTTKARIQSKKDILASYLFYNKQQEPYFNFIGDEKEYINLENKTNINFITDKIINDFQKISFSEKIDKFLLFLASQSNYIGEKVEISIDEFISASFIHRFNKAGQDLSREEIIIQEEEIVNYLVYDTEKKTGNFLEAERAENNNLKLKLNVKAWDRIGELQKNDNNSKNVFIAMSYNNTQSIRDALKLGISRAGYTPILMDETIHNQQIVPEMFKNIRDSKFLVIDTSIPNNGAYYEAGYALGLGKEVIFCCKKDVFDDGENRPHFDVIQKQILIWENEEELTDKLEKWINSLFK